VAVSGEIRWPLLGTFLAAYGEDLMAADNFRGGWDSSGRREMSTSSRRGRGKRDRPHERASHHPSRHWQALPRSPRWAPKGSQAVGATPRRLQNSFEMFCADIISSHSARTAPSPGA
jgi:hypothetical protein